MHSLVLNAIGFGNQPSVLVALTFVVGILSILAFIFYGLDRHYRVVRGKGIGSLMLWAIFAPFGALCGMLLWGGNWKKSLWIASVAMLVFYCILLWLLPARLIL